MTALLERKSVLHSSRVGSSLVREEDPSLEVLGRLREMIDRKRIQPGTRMPSERALALELEVGRPAIREAIKALQILDVLETRRGDGTYVKSLSGLAGSWPSHAQLPAADFDMIELLETRKMFEPKSAALAAARADERQLEAIERELVAQEKDPTDRTVFPRLDFLFHEAIIRAAGNQVLLGVAQSLSPLLMKSRTITGKTTPDLPRIVEQHRIIFEAIKTGDSDLAEHAMRLHLQTVGLDLISQRKSR